MATGALIAGAALQIGGGIFGGLRAKRSSKKRARLLRQQALLEREAAKFDALQQARSFEKLMGRQRLAIAASGIKLEGSPLLILEETLRDKQETIRNILETGEARVGALTSQAQEVQRAGRNALIGSIIGSVGTALQTRKTLKTGAR